MSKLPTFTERVGAFWDWYASVSERFLKTIDDGNCSNLATEVSAKIDELLPDFGWVFGPGEGEAKHSFTLSGNGVFSYQLLALRWLEMAPALPGWTFYAARQASKPPRGKIQISGLDFEAQAFWLTPTLDEEDEVFHLIVWHPLFSKIPDKTQWMALYLFLDEALGEVGVQNWIGRIEISDRALAGAIPLTELPDLVQSTAERTGWKKYGPGESWSIYCCWMERAACRRSWIHCGRRKFRPERASSSLRARNAGGGLSCKALADEPGMT